MLAARIGHFMSMLGLYEGGQGPRYGVKGSLERLSITRGVINADLIPGSVIFLGIMELLGCMLRLVFPVRYLNFLLWTSFQGLR